MPFQARQIREAFSRRYILGLLILAALSTLAFFSTFHLTHFEKTRAKTLAIAASQPAASQRIAFLANAYASADNALDRKEYRTELRRAIRDMEAAHNYLTLREPVTDGERRNLSAVQDIYFTGATPFDVEMKAFLDNARAVAATPEEALTPDLPSLAKLNLAGSNFVMQTHGLIVRILQERAEAAVKRTEALELAIWALTLVVLILEGYVIFRPMGRRIEESVEAIEHAEAEAQAANASKSNFLRLISHEIRTPLNAVTGVAQILAKSDLPPNAADKVQVLAAASDHLMSLTGNVLDFSQLEEGGVALASESFNLREELDHCAAMAAPLIEEKSLSFEVDIAQCDLRTLGDASRLRRIALNLLSNAAKFTDAGSVRLQGRLVGRDETAATVEIAVSDTGVGMSEDSRARLFSAFENIDPFETRRQGGAGLGLAIAGKLARLMDARIDVKSAPGGGSVFTLTLSLPLDRTVQPPQEQAPASEARARRVLVVEDNIPNQMIAKAFLKANGFDVVIANNGREALDAVAQGKFDLVLMDINMPVMDGLEATRILRQNPDYKATPILAFTAHAIDEDQATILNAGLNDILKKPITEKGLVERVNRWIETATAQSAA